MLLDVACGGDFPDDRRRAAKVALRGELEQGVIEISVSGRAEGLAACSALDFFSLVEGSITDHISRKVADEPGISLSFGVLTFFIEALPHASARGTLEDAAISVKSIKRLGRFHTGAAMKVFELTLTDGNFYSLSKSQRHRRAVDALLRVAEKILDEFEGADGARLSALIVEGVGAFVQEHRHVAGTAAI